MSSSNNIVVSSSLKNQFRPAVRKRDDLQEMLDREVYPAILRDPNQAFPEFGWTAKNGGWIATNWPSGIPEQCSDPRADRLEVYADNPHRIKLHGRSVVRWLDYVNGGRKPTGQEFIDCCRELARRVGVQFPEIKHKQTPEEIAESQFRELRRDFLRDVIDVTHEMLWETKEGEVALKYLTEKRHLNEQAIREFKLGIAARTDNVVGNRLCEMGWNSKKLGDATNKQLYDLLRKMGGYITIPWYDELGRVLTIYGRWHSDDFPLMKEMKRWRGKRDQLQREWESGDKQKTWEEPRIPKTYALPGKESKCVPFMFDRVIKNECDSIILVEGVLDAMCLQAAGERRAVATVGAQLSGEQIKTLARYHNRFAKAYVCGDPDGGGDAGNIRNTQSLERIGITPYVMERLPDGLDPDEYIHKYGMDEWEKRVRSAKHGYRHIGEQIITKHAQKYGERLDGDDQWTDDLIKAALSEIKQHKGVSPHSIKYLLEPVSKVTGWSVDELRSEVMFTPGEKAENGVKQQDATETTSTSPLDLGWITSGTFFATNYDVRWYTHKILIKGMPCVWGGPKKCLKTSTLIDLCVSLGTATKYLDRYKTFGQTKVVLLSAESGEAAIQATARRICAARGVDPMLMDGYVYWGFTVPKFTNPDDMSTLHMELKKLGSEGVCVIDPLYMALQGGYDVEKVNAGNLYDIGPLLLTAARACLEAGWTPILCHHARKNTDREMRPMELDDLSMAGIAEFARQWVMVSRREEYDPEEGTHKLWMLAGSSSAGGIKEGFNVK